MAHNKSYFFCLGAQKSGTTTIHDILIQHTDLCLPSKKETKFFAFEENYTKGLDFYRSFFNCHDDKKLFGEIDPDYLLYEGTSKRIYDTFGKDTKFIIILRDPLQRAISHYNMEVYRGYETIDFLDAIQQEHIRIKDSEINYSRFSYLIRGKYYEQIQKYLNYFPIQNFLFLTYEEDIVSNMNKTIAKIFEFLGINFQNIETAIYSNKTFQPRFGELTKKKINSSTFQKIKMLLPETIRKIITNCFDIINNSGKPPQADALSHSKKREIRDTYFKDDIEKLSILIDIDFNKLWKI